MNSETEDSRRLRQAAEWLLRLSDQAQPEADLAAWISWCEADPKNLLALESLESLWCCAKENPPPAPVIARLLRAEPTAGAQPVAANHEYQPRELRMPFRVAASVALFAGALALMADSAPWRVPAPAAIAPAPVATVLAQNQNAVLADGSNVDLGARTSLDVEFTSSHRWLKLRSGEAYFEVKHDKTRPFVVSAGNVQVVAVGTAFDVRRSDSEVVISVQEGTVDIFRAAQLDPTLVLDPTAPPTARTKSALRATVGEQVIFNAATGQVRRSLVDPSVAVAWRQGRMEFLGDSLDSVIAAVNRYASRPIVLADPSLGKVSFTGTVFLDSIDQWIDSLPKVLPIVIDRRDHDAIALRRRLDERRN
jgi:transmembrane sensor